MHAALRSKAIAGLRKGGPWRREDMARELHRGLYLPSSILFAATRLLDFASEIPRFLLLPNLRQVQMIAIVLLLPVRSTACGILPHALVKALLSKRPPSRIDLML